jgi:transposase
MASAFIGSNIPENREIRFKDYDQSLRIHLPVLLEDLVSDKALARIINELEEGIALSKLERYYSGIGRPGYHPRMLIKVWLYGYCTGVCTSRPLAKKLREDLSFMWLAGGQRPSFKTLSSFRSSRMQDVINEVLSSVLRYLVEHEYLNDLYTDGSKWEANANKYKITWRKNTERYKDAVLERIAGLLEKWQALQREEDASYGNRDLASHKPSEAIAIILHSEQLESQVKHLNMVVEQTTSKKLKRSLKSCANQLAKEQEKLKKYEEQERIIGQRNSFVKTDPDATGMRMKDDALKPGYNGQITTSGQFILGASIHQHASDSPTLPSHLEQLENQLAGLLPTDWQPDHTMDAGYGSEENYALLAQEGHTAYVKYPLWYQEHTGKLAKKAFHSANWHYDPVSDCYECPSGQLLFFKEIQTKTTANGYERNMRVYEAKSCQGCALFEQCRGENAKPTSQRTVRRSVQLEAFKSAAKERLASETGKRKRAQRSIDVETPFANIKYNMGHRRFLLRGIEKVSVEFLLLATAHNIIKIHSRQTGIWQQHDARRAAKKALKSK